MQQEISLAGVLPIHTGRGTEAERRKADDRGGQNLTVQYINHVESAMPQLAVKAPQPIVESQEIPMNPTQAAPAINIPMDVVQPEVATFEKYLEQETKIDHEVIAGVVISTTQYVEYAQKLVLDWDTLPEQVMFAFIANDGTIYGVTHEPVPNFETGDLDMVEGKRMIIGHAPISVRRTTHLTLTPREEVVKEEPESLLVDVNQDVTPAGEPVEQPYYATWGRRRRNAERNRLRSKGQPVPADL